MLFSKTTILLALVPASIAATCNSAKAQLYTASSNGGGGSNSQSSIDAALTTCTVNCGVSGSCIVGCLNTACASHCEGRSIANCQLTCMSDVCSAFYGSGSDSPNGAALQACYKAQGLGSKKRATSGFECSSSQTCYKEANGNLFCLNVATGDYVDHEGGQGNVNTNEYTSSADLPASTATRASSTGTSSASTTAVGALVTSATTSSTGSAASPTGGAGMEKMNAVGIVGAMGLVVGLVL